MNKILIVLAFGILLRVILSFSTFHPDIKALSDGGQFVSDGYILNLYDYSSNTLVLNYPPLVYWFFGLLNFILNGNIPILKLSYLFFDISLGMLLYKMVDSRKALLAFSLWIFNPVSLYVTYMIGQFDVIPTFFNILSIYFVTKNKLSLAALSLGGGIAFKLYPIFLVIPLLVLAKGFWAKIKLAVLAGLPYLISILPYLPSSSFRYNALFASQSSKSFYATIPVSGGEAILLFPAILVIFYLLIWRKNLDRLFFWRILFIPLLLFFTLTHYHPQWLIWIAPFIVLELVFNKLKNILPIVLIFFSWVGSLLFFDSSLTLGLFSPIFPVLKDTLDIWTLINVNVDYNFSRSVLQTIFAASSVYLIHLYFPRSKNG